jgi:uncharacterized FAD-dependent dehydrogenase
MAQQRTEIVELFVSLGGEDPAALRQAASQRLGVSDADIAAVRVARRSLDARKGRPLGLQLKLEVDLGAPRVAEPRRRPAASAARGKRVVIVGAGPAGTFAALWLAEAGASVTICELGKAVQPRRHDLAQLVRKGALDPASNYCFGEGGAGTFSDGKLYTRVKDREAVAEVLALLIEHGADDDIRVENRPHVGSNRLPIILQGMRAALEGMGVTYRWSDPLVDFVTDGDRRISAAVLASGAELSCDALVLATGHSARAIYELLDSRGVALEAKPFAIGARLEHPQPLIDRIQYGAHHGHPALPAAFYHVAAQVQSGGRKRGVYSFCMCPGGWIVDSSTEAGRLATNGMSLKRRDSPFANAAMIVSVEPEDLTAFARRPGDPLAGLAFQRHWEARAYAAGGGAFTAVANRLDDFTARRATSQPGRTSYRPKISGGRLDDSLPEFVTAGLRAAIPVIARTMRGFDTGEAQLIGIETRSSAPLRIVRDADSLESPSHPGLYPAAEGAGYAGGIVSAAIDGLRIARRITERGRSGR